MSFAREPQRSVLKYAPRTRERAPYLPHPHAHTHARIRVPFSLKRPFDVFLQLLRNMRQVVSYAVGEPRRFGDNDERMHVLSNAVDVILESVDMALDEATGSAPSKVRRSHLFPT